MSRGMSWERGATSRADTREYCTWDKCEHSMGCERKLFEKWILSSRSRMLSMEARPYIRLG
eukprot:638193-Rhodomonas_salina.2